MSNFAEFDVPEAVEPNNTSEKQETNVTSETRKSQPKKTKTKPSNIGYIILSIIGWIALAFTIAKIYGLFNSAFQYPLQFQLATMTLPLMLVAVVAFKLSKKLVLSKLGLFLVYASFAIFAVDKIYSFVTTGAISWA